MADNCTPYTSSTYDKHIINTIPYYENFHSETINILEAANIKPKSWLDTGCGTGTLVERALPKFPNTRFVLVDPSPKMLEFAKNKLARHQCAEIEFLEPTPTQDLTIQKEKFDVVSAIQSHHYLKPKDRVKATKVCFEILSKEGVFITFENVRPFTPKGIAIGKEYWKKFQLSQGRNPQMVEEHLKRFDVEYFPITVEQHLSLLRKTGFEVVELFWYSIMQAGFFCMK